jgi:FtsZ-binding cell division protein ZapB
VVFRDESLRLFERLVQKDKEIEEMKAKNEEMLAEKKYMDESVKALTKRNKQLEIQVA